MTRPGIITRVIGSPLIGLVLLSACAYLLYNWKFVGNATTLTALFAVGIALRTIGALRRMRAYKAWMREWEAMGTPANETGAGDPRTTRRRWPLVFCLLFAVGFPLVAFNTPGDLSRNSTLQLFGFAWLAACFYVLIRCVRLIKRGAVIPATKPDKAIAPVSWMVGEPSSSSSRADATKALPEYCMKLLARSDSRRKFEGGGRVLEGEPG